MISRYGRDGVELTVVRCLGISFAVSAVSLLRNLVFGLAYSAAGDGSGIAECVDADSANARKLRRLPDLYGLFKPLKCQRIIDTV